METASVLIVKYSSNDNSCLVFSCFQMASTNHYAGIHCLAFCHEWMHCFNKLTGAPNGVVLPEFFNLYDGALDSLVAQGVDPRRASSEFAIHCAAKRREAGNSKFLGGCNRAMYSGELCIHHQPIKAEKNDRCRGCGHVLGVETGERDLCQPCYRKPEATVARKAVVAEKEAARGEYSTRGCKCTRYWS